MRSFPRYKTRSAALGLTLLMACAAASAQVATPPAQGLIIGYRASVADADPEQIDRSPRAGERERDCHPPCAPEFDTAAHCAHASTLRPTGAAGLSTGARLGCTGAPSERAGSAASAAGDRRCGEEGSCIFR